jgi:peptide/nickel transport system permease protein
MKMLTSFLANQFAIIRQTPIGAFGALVFTFFIVIAIIGPEVAPFDPWTTIRATATGRYAIDAPPSAQFLLGTTNLGRDIFSQLLVATRNTLAIGLAAGALSTVIGVHVGLFAGYFGGRTDDILMRLTDITYGLPFLPFVVILVSLFGHNALYVVLAVGLIIWRSAARVLRANVLSLRERQFIQAARARGCGDLRIIYRHILPNLLPLVLLYTAFNVSWAVIAEAGASFLGFGDPDRITWGSMLFDLWSSGNIRTSWWWFAPPTLCIVLLTTSLVFISRAYEEVANPRLRRR